MTKTNALVLAIALASTPVLSSCERGDANQSAEGAGCDETVTLLAQDEDSPLGFSADDILDFAEAAHEEILGYPSGEATWLTVTISYDAGEIRFVDSEPAEVEGDSEVQLAAPYCEDRLEIEARVTFATDDGLFDEQQETVLSMTNPDVVSFFLSLAPEELGGTYQLEVPPGAEDYDEVEIMIDGLVDRDDTEGTISAQFSGSEEGDGEGVAWATNMLIGEWPPVDEETVR